MRLTRKYHGWWGFLDHWSHHLPTPRWLQSRICNRFDASLGSYDDDDLEYADLKAAVARTCYSLSPPDDPGCCCGREKGHGGKHLCASEECGTEWESWDSSGYNMDNYGK